MFYNSEKTAYFKQLLVQVVGQPLAAAGYRLEDAPMQHQRGLLRYKKHLAHLGEDVYGFLEWQLLAFEQSRVARFQITLLRNQGIEPRAKTAYIHQNEQSLAWVMWHVFNARLLPADDSWWDFRTQQELGFALANSGKLLFAYGVPWLEMRKEDLP